jgi:prophage antirepressor-like protein
MLLRGHATASEPFRKWVTEEVLPTIRKTGNYDAEQSTNPAVLRTSDRVPMRHLSGSLGPGLAGCA